MKTSIVIFCFISCFYLSFSASAQVVPVDEDTKKITYKEVVQQEGEASKLYNQGISWINSYYPNPTDVTRIRDVENGKIEIKHRFKIFDTDKKGVKTEAGVINYTMTLEFKEGRYRYTITDFGLAALSKFPLEKWLDKNDPSYKPECEGYLEQVNTQVNELIKNMKTGMVPKVIKPDEW